MPKMPHQKARAIPAWAPGSNPVFTHDPALLAMTTAMRVMIALVLVSWAAALARQVVAAALESAGSQRGDHWSDNLLINGWQDLKEATPFLSGPVTAIDTPVKATVSLFQRNQPYHGTSPHWRPSLFRDRKRGSLSGRFMFDSEVVPPGRPLKRPVRHRVESFQFSAYSGANYNINSGTRSGCSSQGGTCASGAHGGHRHRPFPSRCHRGWPVPWTTAPTRAIPMCFGHLNLCISERRPQASRPHFSWSSRVSSLTRDLRTGSIATFRSCFIWP